MKKVTVHWVEMRTLEVPDECPTDDVDEFNKWMYDRFPLDPFDPMQIKNLVVKGDSRDFEIVDVEVIVPENEKMGTREDIHQR